MPSNHNLTIRTAFVALTMAATAAMTSCSDNEPDIHYASDGRIAFSVSEETSHWNQIGGSRGRLTLPRTVVEMTGGADKLYLIGNQVAGINSDKPAGRAEAVTATSINDFGVYAAYTLTAGEGTDGLIADYMNNVEITRDNGWSAVDEYLWPGEGFLHINAFSPYTSVEGEEGVIALPGSEETGGLTLSYRVPVEAADQLDLMWAKPVDASSSPCNLTFEHALTAIRFVAGSKLAPCKVTKISVSGVDGEGVLNIETGEWSDLGGTMTYDIVPDLELSAAAGSQYVEPETPLTSDGETLMLIPQTVPLGTTVSLSISINGQESEFTADISGTEWIAGTTMVYRISASADNGPGLILEVVDSDGNRVDSIASPYTGGSYSYQVRSYSNDGTAATDEIEWEAELLDESGNKLASLPQWIKSITESGKGTSDLDVATRLREPIFLQINEHTKTLRQTPDINTTSGVATYNLAGHNGSAAVENTANCYIINAPGHYSLPLVYGNAIKDGATNEAAYKSTLTHNRTNQRKALFSFINHLGNEITDPYIYNNQDCTPADGVLVWQERIGTVADVALSSDGKSIEFNIPAEFIRQGNAMLAVRDANGNVMWSWQLWITDYVGGSNLQPIDVDGTTGYIYPLNLGRIYGGDETEFKESRATLRLTQKNVPDGLTPLTADIPVVQAGTTVVTNDCGPFYQWGRKDPLRPGVQSYYNSLGQIMSGSMLPSIEMGSTHKDIVERGILHPDKVVIIVGDNNDLRKISPYYTNLWDIDHVVTNPEAVQAQNIKTIYDPCPVGAKIPVGNEFRMLTDGTYDATAHTKNFVAADGLPIAFKMFGYLSGYGTDTMSTATGAYWTALCGGSTVGLSFILNENIQNLVSNRTLQGYSVRPGVD